MNLSTNDFANRELSIEELDAIAGGSLWGWIKHEVHDVVHWAGSAKGLFTIATVAGAVIFGASTGKWTQ
jgi:hypothetical protein